MPTFVRDEPKAFYTTPVLVHHEAGHLLVAYYFGFPIGRLKYYPALPGVVGASIKNIIHPQFEGSKPKVAYTAKSVQLLAGELAGRRYAKLALDQVCMALPSPEVVDEKTCYKDLVLPQDRQRMRDEIRVIEYVRDVGVEEDWWKWFWSQHAEAGQILERNWDLVLRLAERIIAVPPYANAQEERRQQPSGRIAGGVLLDWLHELNAPIYDREYTSVLYETQD